MREKAVRKAREKAEHEAKERADEEFTLETDPKSLHATVLMQTVYNAVVWHSGGFLKHMVISVTVRATRAASGCHTS